MYAVALVGSERIILSRSWKLTIPYELHLQVSFFHISNKNFVLQDEWCMYIFQVEQANIETKVSNVINIFSCVLGIIFKLACK